MLDEMVRETLFKKGWLAIMGDMLIIEYIFGKHARNRSERWRLDGQKTGRFRKRSMLVWQMP
jgi:hypothetical protein